MKSKLKKTLLVMLSAVMVFNTPLSVLAESAKTTDSVAMQEEAKKDATTPKYEIVSVKDYDGSGEYGSLEVTLKEAEKIDEKLPQTIPANVKLSGDEKAKEEEQEVPVSWSCPDEITKAGTYTYTITPGDGYVWSDELQKAITEKTYKLPAYTVSVVEETKAEAKVKTYASNPDEGIEAQAGGSVVNNLNTSAIYYIYAIDQWNHVMDTRESSMNDGARLQVRNRTTMREDKFGTQTFNFCKYEGIGDFYYIRKYSKNGWKYITSDPGGGPNGGTVYITDWYGKGKDDLQLFRIIQNNDGTYSIYNKVTNRPLTYKKHFGYECYVDFKSECMDWKFKEIDYLRDDPKVKSVKEGTTTDGTYSFTPKINKNTSIEVLNYNGVVHKRTDNYNAENKRFYDYWGIVPTDNDIGKVGFMFKDVGKYNGKTVDLKATISWPTNFQYNGTRITPYIGLFASKEGGDFSFAFFDASYKVTYEILIDGKITPINMRITMTDIDAMQFTELETDTGSINSISIVEGNDHLHQIGNATDKTTGCIFAGERATSDADLEGWVSCEVKDTSKYSVLYGSPRDTSSYYDYKDRMTYSDDYIRQKGAPALINRVGKIDSILDDPNLDILNAYYWMSYTSNAFGPITLPKPTETVSASVINPGNSYYYDVYQLLPQESDNYKYKALTETIKIEKDKLGLTTAQMQDIAKSVVVKDDSESDITKYFSMESTNDSIQCTLNPSGMSKLDELYGSTLHFRLKVPTMSAKDALNKTFPREIVSKATTTITRRNTGKTETAESNQTTIKMVEKYYFKIVESYLNGFTKGEGNVKNKTAYKTELNVTKHQEATPVAYTDSDMIAVPKGFHFDKVTESGKDYNMSTYEPISRNLHFQADYVPIYYKLTYDLKGGTLAKANPSSYNVIYSPTLNEPTKEGYAFDGWTVETPLFSNTESSKTLLKNYSFHTKSPNAFDRSKVQIYSPDGKTLLNEIGTSNTVGKVSFGYAHNRKSGYYTIRIAANGNNKDDELMMRNIYFEEGRVYNFSYTQNSLSKTSIYISNFCMETLATHTTSGNTFTSCKVALYDNDNKNLVSELGTFTKSGAQTVKYTHNAETGYYTISFIGSGYTDRKLVSYSDVYLEKGAEYEISFNVGFTKSSKHLNNISNETMKQTSKITGINVGKDGKALASANYLAESYTRRTGALHLVANWKLKNYTVHYNGNGADKGSMKDSTFVYGKDETLPKNLFTKVGYTFDHWNKKADGSDKDNYKDGATVKNLADPGKDVTLFAQWKPNTYTIRYDSNKPSTASGNITGTTANSTHSYDTAKNLTANGYKLTGWTFTGWKDSNGKTYTDKQSVKNLTTENGATIVLYAQWKPNTYTIKYDGNGATSGSTPDSNMTYDKPGTLNKNGFKKDNATFIGWKDEAGKSYKDGQTVSNLTPNDKGVVKLIAQWDLAPEIKANDKTYYEGMTVTRADLLKDVIANDKEDSVITNKLIITKIEYSAGKLVSGKKQAAYTQEWVNGMPADATLDTWFMQLDKADSPVKHKVTYKVVDKAGNVTTKTVTVYVKYNNAPVITTMDRYYTLKQAQSGEISADELLKNSITNNKMKSTDIEEGNLSSKVELVDFNPADFTKLTTSAVVTVTYRVHDSYGPNGVGKETINQFKVYVTDPDRPPLRPDDPVSIVKHVRFITKKYYDMNKDKSIDLSDEELAKANANGGLRVGCSWYTDEDYKSEITATFDKTSGTTYKFSHEDVEKIQEYINTNGIGNAKKTNSLSTFYQKFLNK